MSDVLKDNPVAADHLKNISLHGDAAELQDRIECENYVNMLVFQKDHKSNEQNGIGGNGFHFRRAFMGSRGGATPTHAPRLDGREHDALLITAVSGVSNRYNFIVREPRPCEDLYIDIIIGFPYGLLVDNNNNLLLRSEPAFELLRKEEPVFLCTNELMWNGTSFDDNVDKKIVQYRYNLAVDLNGTAETAPVKYLKECASNDEKILHLKCFLSRWSMNLEQKDFVFCHQMKGIKGIYYSMEMKDFLFKDNDGGARSYKNDFELLFKAAWTAYNKGHIMLGNKLNDFFTKHTNLSEISGVSCILKENSPIWDKLATAEENDLRKFYCEKVNGEMVNKIPVPFICHQYRMTKGTVSYEKKGFPNLLTDSAVLKIPSFQDMGKAVKFCWTLNLSYPINAFIGYIKEKTEIVGGSAVYHYTYLCRCEEYQNIIGIPVKKPVHHEILFSNGGWGNFDKVDTFSSGQAKLYLTNNDSDIKKCDGTIGVTYYDMEKSQPVSKQFPN